MKDTYVYRKGTMEDCQAVYDLICEMECRQLPFEKFSEIYRAQICSNHYYCLVCLYDRSIIGVINLRFEEQLHHAQRITEIMEFAVTASHRKKGIGKKMLSYAYQIAKEFGCTQIEAACNQLRLDTHRFYTREGMRNFHFKFSKALVGQDPAENAIGR